MEDNKKFLNILWENESDDTLVEAQKYVDDGLAKGEGFWVISDTDMDVTCEKVHHGGFVKGYSKGFDKGYIVGSLVMGAAMVVVPIVGRKIMNVWDQHKAKKALKG